MLYLVTGGSASGKSEYAEQRAAEIYEKKGQKRGTLYYVATMQCDDAETRERIRRHRVMREGKPFVTQEQPTGIGQLSFRDTDVVLVECLSNLLANEMYAANGSIKERDPDRVVQQLTAYIVEPLCHLAGKTEIVVVSNEVFSDGVRYDGQTQEYLRLLGIANCLLAEAAAEVTEVVCGIPIRQKGEKG